MSNNSINYINKVKQLKERYRIEEEVGRTRNNKKVPVTIIMSKNKPSIIKPPTNNVIAKQLNAAIKDKAEKDKYKELKRKARSDREKGKILEILSKNTIQEADKYFSNQNVLNFSEYKLIKNKYINKWLLDKNPNLSLNPEQVEAIGTVSGDVILKARAGSGKTRVATVRTHLLIDHERIDQNQLLLLAFNRKAAQEITNRIHKDYRMVDFSSASTFHSLAYKIGMKEGYKLLFDESKNGSLTHQKQSDFIQKIIKDVANPAFKSKMYKLFRLESEEISNIGELLSEQDYFMFRRNFPQVTLNNESVKSKGEKYIADLLFEHDISYVYERQWSVKDGGWEFDKNKGVYKPDFSLLVNSDQPNLVIEHWGIDETDPKKETPAHWKKTWSKYKEEMDRKRLYWKVYNENHIDNQVVLIETSIKDMAGGRESFEDILLQKLANVKVLLKKLPEDDLIQKVEHLRKAKITEMFVSYIGKAEKYRFSPDYLSNKVSSTTISDQRVAGFYELANLVYRRYIEKIEKQCLLDFDCLIEKAITEIHKLKGDCSFKSNDILFNLNKLKYLMIDEYQDFSPLFFHLIDAIRKYNKELKVFCVGDDWQAINGFAGSDLMFFNDFTKYFPYSEELNLLTNYRSSPLIVNASNKFMHSKGLPSKAGIKTKGFIGRVYINDINLYPNNDEDQKFIENKNTYVDRNLSRMLKFCHSIVTHGKNINKSIIILNRTEIISSGCNTFNFSKRLKSICLEKVSSKNYDKNISVLTTHKSKGLEADIVIMLNVNSRKYPLVHPDIIFNQIFDENFQQNNLDEEKRLFYVAISRPKSELYLLSDEKNKSDYFGVMGTWVDCNEFYNYKMNKLE